MVSNLADGDIIKIQHIYELPIVALFNHLSYKISSGHKKQA